ncbi:MAG TPA: hypothetical protein PLP11_08185 [Bacteroidales bacterium]|nr:hypothetical protein [Bacteroidales bacterium]
MKKAIGIFLLGSLLFFGCSNRKFNSEQWKTKKDEQFYMLNDIVDNKILTGKTKDEIIELLDTIGIKQFNYSDNSWMFVISIPNSLATEKAVEIMDIEFEKDKVKQVKIRQ